MSTERPSMSEATRYDPSTIEPKWQAYWEEHQTFRTPEGGDERVYVLDMFPYPSGHGLHVGHPEGYTATDILCRYHRARGKSVLHPMGWDAFGLPAEQHAVRTGTHPRDTTRANINNFRRQLKMLGFSYDWQREVDTTDPGYVRWTQWIFLQLFQRGLAYQDEITVNWCPALGTVLANEEVIDGLSEIGDHPVERRPLRQWVLRITAYADRLLEGLSEVAWPNSTRTMQQAWIGRSEGAEVQFGVAEHPGERIDVYTTRPDTLYGATFVVLAPEHPLVECVTTAAQRPAVEAYVEEAKNKSDLARQQSKEKSGVFTGAYAINPVNECEVPIWVADYVLYGYGTGAIMAVPGGDERDFAFAKAYGLPIVEVVSESGEPTPELTAAYAGTGKMLNSGPYNGLPTSEAKPKITAALEQKGKGRGRIQYKLRDWVFSRQRYWGEPIPILFPVRLLGGHQDPRSGEEGVDFEVDYTRPMPVAERELPVRLPELDDYRPGDDPRGVLARARGWRFVQRDGAWWARETNTMPQWAGSCWYYLRFTDPHNRDAPFGEEAARAWLPVDLYVGGAEHAVLHLLYARFWHMVLYDAGLVPVPEPFARLVHQGIILGEVEYRRFDGPDGPVSREHAERADEGDAYKDARTGALLTVSSVGADEAQKRKDGAWVLASNPAIVLEARAYKMSKTRGNVVNPDDIVEAFGADALRVYEMFMGPLEASKPWSTESIAGVKKFLGRAFHLASEAGSAAPDEALRKLIHRTTDKVTHDIEALRFNTAISAMMVLANELARAGAPKEGVSVLARLVHPFAPHLGEEMWSLLGHAPSIQHAPWPAVDPAYLVDDQLDIPVQVKGKTRGTVQLPAGATEAQALEAARTLPRVNEALEAGTLRRTIWVPDKILNLIIS